MINRSENMPVRIEENFRGGTGEVIIKDLTAGRKPGSVRDCNEMTLFRGCSVGFHRHNGVGEVIYVLHGEGVYSDGEAETHVRAGDALVKELQMLVHEFQVSRAAACGQVAGILLLPSGDLVSLMLCGDSGTFCDLDNLVEAKLEKRGLDLAESTGELSFDCRGNHCSDLLSALKHLDNRHQSAALGDSTERA